MLAGPWNHLYRSLIARAIPAVVIVLFLLAVATGIAAPLSFVPVRVTQPDGQVLDIFASGDEYYNWLHDSLGYTIVTDPATGFYVYAAPGKNRLLPTPYVAGRDDPATVGLTPWCMLPAELLASRRQDFIAAHPADRVTAPTLGSFTNLAIFIRFAGESEFAQTFTTYGRMFNNGAAGSSSLYNYFREASYGAVTISSDLYPQPAANDTVISYQDSHPRAYFQPYDSVANPAGYTGGDNGTDRRNREHALLKAAVDSVAKQIPASANYDSDNDGRVDNVVFIVKGGPTGWASLLWPHAWSLYSLTASINGKRVYGYNLQLQTSINVGVLCHEMYHSLGAPDLYRYTTSGTPVGGWDIMAVSVSTPMHMGAHMKYRYGGWIASEPVISAPGTYWLKPVTSPTKNVYKILSPYTASEYFVVEYRKRVGVFETAGLPGEGLLVYRILTGRSGNANGPPDEVYVYRPGGGFSGDSLRRAMFYAGSGHESMNDYTSPASFLSGGTPGGLSISGVGARGDSISFQLGAPVSGVVDSLTALLIRPDSIVVSWAARAQYRNRWFSIERADSLNSAWSEDPSTAIGGAGTTSSSIRYSIVDRRNPGKRYYRIRSTDSSGAFVASTVTAVVNFPVGVEEEEAFPVRYALEQNFPNPFNPVTEIGYSIPRSGHVRLEVFSILGEKVAVLVDEIRSAGIHAARFNGSGLASGVYLYRLTSGSFSAVRKLMLVK